MAKIPDTPFTDIESAYQYVALLREALDDEYQSVEVDIDTARGASGSQRRADALGLVLLKLDELRRHLLNSLILLNDLRTLRRLLLGERGRAAGAQDSGHESDDG